MHLCVAFEQRYIQMRSNRPFAAAAACKSHASHAHHAHANKWCLHGVCDACDLQAVAVASG
eukprot:8562704-Lingulodinium_polyedra.AAC.1